MDSDADLRMGENVLGNENENVLPLLEKVKMT